MGRSINFILDDKKYIKTEQQFCLLQNVFQIIMPEINKDSLTIAIHLNSNKNEWPGEDHISME